MFYQPGPKAAPSLDLGREPGHLHPIWVLVRRLGPFPDIAEAKTKALGEVGAHPDKRVCKLKRLMRNSGSGQAHTGGAEGIARTNGRWGGKLPIGKATVRIPDLSFSAAVRKAATNSA